MARVTAPDGRSRIPLLVLVAVLTIALIAGGAYLLGRSQTTPTVNDAASSPASAPAESRIPSTDPTETDPAPTGCLAGPDRDVQMVLDTQEAAPHTTYGAVELAASLFRWGVRYPYPTAAEVRALTPALDPATAAEQRTDYVRDYQRGYRQPPGDEVADGTEYYVTTANGDWLTTSASTADEVVVQLETHPVVDDSYRTDTGTLQVELHWVDGSWHIRGVAMADAQALANGGTTFTSGC